MDQNNIFTDLPRIATKLLNEPWLILPSHHLSMVEQLIQFRANTDLTQFKMAAPAKKETPQPPPGYVNRITTFDEASGLAVINIEGTIGKKLSLLDTMCGGFDLNALEDGLSKLADLKPTAVQLYLDTPGGTVTGVAEAAAMIEEFAGMTAPVHAYVDIMCCSAGEWLASGASSRTAAPSALLGSIGVYNAMFDQSGRYADAGVKVHLMASGPLKGAGFPGTAPTAAQLTAMQSEVDRLAEEFQGQMLRRRPNLDPKMHFSGGTFRAGSPAGAALTDGIVANRSSHMMALAHKYARKPGRK